LVVGRQHFLERESRRRYGYELLLAAVKRGAPDLVVYVVPDRLGPQYAKDIETIREVSEHCPIYVLEFSQLRQLGRNESADHARRSIFSRGADLGALQVPLLIPAGSDA